MAVGETKLILRLVADESTLPPVGFVIARKASEGLMEKLFKRLSHYAFLHLVATPDDLIFLAHQQTDLPWHPDIRFFFYECGPAFLPTGSRLEVPGRWRDEVVSRLAIEFAQPLPVLLMPSENGEALRSVSLAGAKPLIDIDLQRLAGECAA